MNNKLWSQYYKGEEYKKFFIYQFEPDKGF